MPLSKPWLHAILGVVLVLAVANVVLSAFNNGLNVYDEGISVYGGLRVLHGDIPYRDFWTLYPPGQFYLLAGLFKIVGPSLFASRILAAVVMLACPLVVALIVRRLQGVRSAVAAWTLAMLCLPLFGFYAAATPSACLCVLGACALLIRFLHDGGRWPLFASGLLYGTAALFRHDTAVYALVPAVLVLLGPSLRRGLQRRSTTAAGPRRAWLDLGLLLGGVAVPTAPVAAYLLAKVPVATLIADLVVFPATVFPEFRALPYPAPNVQTAIFYFPIIVYLWAAWLAGGSRRRDEYGISASQTASLWLLIGTGILLLGQARVRSDTQHLFPTLLPAVILFSTCMGRWLQTGNTGRAAARRGAYWALPALTMLTATLTFVKLATYGTMSVVDRCYGPGREVMTVPAGRGAAGDGFILTYESVVQYVREQVPEEEPLFVGNTRHDRIFGNDVMLYFLSGRHCVSRYHELHTGLATTREVQAEIVAELRAAPPPLIVLVAGSHTEPNRSAVSSGVELLDRYIRDHYAREKKIGQYQMWKRE